MMIKKLLFATGLSFALASGAMAATISVTEGNGDNRRLVDGSVDLEDASPGGIGFDLDALNGGTFGAGDTIGIYGRIVSSVDRFSYTFTSGINFDVDFDFDGYDLAGGGSVGAGFSGLVDQTAVLSENEDTIVNGGGKGVRISLVNTLLPEVLVRDFVTNWTSLTSADSSIFSNVAAGSWTLVVDGSVGPNTRRAALYDIEISAVPLPAGGLLLLGGLGGLAALRRRKKAALS